MSAFVGTGPPEGPKWFRANIEQRVGTLWLALFLPEIKWYNQQPVVKIKYHELRSDAVHMLAKAALQNDSHAMRDAGNDIHNKV